MMGQNGSANFPQPSFHAVADHRAPELLGDCQPDANLAGFTVAPPFDQQKTGGSGLRAAAKS